MESNGRPQGARRGPIGVPCLPRPFRMGTTRPAPRASLRAFHFLLFHHSALVPPLRNVRPVFVVASPSGIMDSRSIIGSWTRPGSHAGRLQLRAPSKLWTARKTNPRGIPCSSLTRRCQRASSRYHGVRRERPPVIHPWSFLGKAGRSRRQWITPPVKPKVRRRSFKLRVQGERAKTEQAKCAELHGWRQRYDTIR